MVEGVIALIGVFFVPAVMVVLIVWFRNNAKNKRYQLQAELATKALEKGESIPADLFAEIERKRNPLNTGIICIAAGIGISLFFWLISLTAGEKEALTAVSLGVIPFLIGVAYLIIHFIEKKNATNEDAK